MATSSSLVTLPTELRLAIIEYLILDIPCRRELAPCKLLGLRSLCHSLKVAVEDVYFRSMRKQVPRLLSDTIVPSSPYRILEAQNFSDSLHLDIQVPAKWLCTGYPWIRPGQWHDYRWLHGIHQRVAPFIRGIRLHIAHEATSVSLQDPYVIQPARNDLELNPPISSCTWPCIWSGIMNFGKDMVRAHLKAVAAVRGLDGPAHRILCKCGMCPPPFKFDFEERPRNDVSWEVYWGYRPRDWIQTPLAEWVEVDDKPVVKFCKEDVFMGTLAINIIFGALHGHKLPPEQTERLSLRREVTMRALIEDFRKPC